MSDDYVAKGAVISACGRYRYRLWREWRGTHHPRNWEWIRDDGGGIAKDGAGDDIGWPKAMVFVMLNPSTADGSVDDPTIRRCVGFAKAWQFERLEVINLFAYRATRPSALLALTHNDDPVGHENQSHVDNVMETAGRIVCAWGAHGGHLGQDETMLGWLDGRATYALGLTAAGHPRHPLYCPRDVVLVPFHGRKAK